MDVHTVVVFTIAVALLFDLINGFHDAANSIATIVSTRLLTPPVAVAWAAFFNFVAFFIFHQGVAKTVSGLVKVNAADPGFVWVVLAGLLGAIVWNMFTWWLALPSSSSHAIMGGFSGAGFAYGGAKVLNIPKLVLTSEFIVISPTMGFVLGGLLLVALSWVLRRVRPQKVNRSLRFVRLLSAAGYSIGHGGNDAQKTMGIILAVLVAGGYIDPNLEQTPTWVALSCYAAMALGTALGGWRIIKTLGSRLTKLKSHSAFCAEISGALTLFFATHMKIPVSTTHTIVGAIVGVGSTNRMRGIRWGLASNIVWGWVFTIPAAASTSALCLQIFRWLDVVH
ncbi:MAG TPA: inorganic phosphate transporter, partial [Polyangiaceae bacterium]|nr:inorganic phosphate transporter [Polyangiaceae bacterium]